MAADRHGGSVIVCTSRRTPEAWIAAVEGVLFRPRVYRWSPAPANDNHANDNSNPYDTLLRESACLFVTADSASMILDGCGSGTPTYVIESPNRVDLRRSWRRGLFNRLSRLSESLRERGLARAGERLNAAQDWLHAQHILRYPRDLRRIQDAVYELGLARPASAFDPEMLPIRKAAQDLTRDVRPVRGGRALPRPAGLDPAPRGGIRQRRPGQRPERRAPGRNLRSRSSPSGRRCSPPAGSPAPRW